MEKIMTTKNQIDIIQILKDTGRTMYVNEEVAKSAPTYTGTLEFFKVGKVTTCQELADEYEKRGLVPASILSICQYDKTNRDDLDEKKYVCSQWKDNEGKWCFLAVDQWRDERHVHVYRYDNEWYGNWWGCGVRKSELGTEASEIVEPLSSDLESAIEIVKKAGYKIIKEI